MTQDASLTPMMTQYRRIKSELPADALLLFRLGDFYELFFEDAVAGAQLLNVALTRRGSAPMCGIPYHAAGNYIARILQAGRKVAICDQLEEARPGRLVKREVTQVLSPGAHFDERMLRAERNNFLAAICPMGSVFGLALVDLTTADFQVTELAEPAALLTELERQRPAEIVAPAGIAPELRARLQAICPAVGEYDDWVFAPETAVYTLRDHFRVATLDGFGLRDRAAAIGAAGAALHYLGQHLRRNISHLTRLTFCENKDSLVLDAATLRHLEVLEPWPRDAPPPGSLFGALHRTVTPMGARRLRDWLSQPLAAVAPIRRRQAAVQAWHDHPADLARFRELLSDVRDLERTISRLSTGSGNARDLAALRSALAQIPVLRAIGPALEAAPPVSPGVARQEKLSETLDPSPGDAAAAPIEDDRLLIRELFDALRDCPDLVDLLSRAVVDEPPLPLKEGGLIRDGFDPTLDELRRATREGRDWIARLQQQEIERTGIPSLKVRFNSVFGYYIEVTRANLDKVPADYVRKQTVANAERFVTPALKEMEGKILGAEERGFQREYEIFLETREAVLGRMTEIQETARALAQLDVLGALAETARLFQYVRPRIEDGGVLEIREGRHPVLEQVAAAERFVPNDTRLDLDERQIALITGPNMAGKSTYIRQVAILALLAHTGSFIPAAEARIDLLDRIFTRIGASDDLSRGQSTFMVEMSETANLLNNATRRSLIVLDEIGRGTSTFDGLSLAWSIVEHIHDRLGAKALFATHYHELTELAGRLARLHNFNVAVREWNDQILFLRKIFEGGTDKSYGIHVARLAGVPSPVIERAKIILRNLEESELTPEGNVRPVSRRQADRERLRRLPPPAQLELF
ncbi:MAG TPA: DNA mismatch repair protein MutS [Candidatus Paceibacterota bacterium]|nr:DNA mismatch repair protein MutS [Verrucomicrobiota bacterium]HRZ43927.1 DNA mismatch repair protein MutS [Candidatus Paceibacterota bacterium]